MPVNPIRSVSPAPRVGRFESPSDGIRSNEGGQLVLRLDIPLPDFADPTKSIYYRIERETTPGAWEMVAGAGWQGAPTIVVNRAVGPVPVDPTNPDHWSYIAIDLDGNHSYLKGATVRVVLGIPVVTTAGIVYERRTGTSRF